ncbi:MAG: hypothetical protein HN712_18545 [Gemmatimonadetes bacterium]|jgi:hypothetical protein|nr:hypothetical protein [Gemmatimonadota bacterium]MBT7862325.1 hypothetical protein [Gemmatimonadota bacterium]
MRVIVVGCEYSGVSTLISQVDAWGQARGIHHHLDDHFTIPDAYHLSDEEQAAMLDMLPAIKERFQRFQLVYHVRLLHRYHHILMGGFHIEEAIYGPQYYYPGKAQEVREYEPDMPDSVILVHLHATPEQIRQRMQSAPHPHQLVLAEDVEVILDAFADQVRRSWIRRKITIDTTDLTPSNLLDSFLKLSVPHLEPADAATRMLTA